MPVTLLPSVLICVCLLSSPVDKPNREGTKQSDESKYLLRGDDPASHEPGSTNGSRHPSRNWRDLVGHNVQVEGIAWGGYAKANRSYIILKANVIGIESKDFPRIKLNGKLIRMSGVLRAIDDRMTIRGTEKVVRHYGLVPSTYTVIDRVEWPYLRQSKYIDRKDK